MGLNVVNRSPAANFIDITGMRFGLLSVLGRDLALLSKRGEVFWTCKCDCGNTHSVRSACLRKGVTKSCGCLRTTATHSITHGLSKTKEFKIWAEMRGRCRCPSQTSYKRYGAIGITVCKRWDESFQAFYDDMGPKPSPGHSIDRINPTGNYEPSNCRWATAKEQSMNTRRTVWVEWNGERIRLRDLAERYGVDPEASVERYKRGNWPLERVLSTKTVKRGCTPPVEIKASGRARSST